MSAAREGRGRTWIVLALIAAAALYLHHEVLFGGAVYHMDDAADGYYPCHVAIARAYAQGSLPAWERGAATGWPMVADPYYGPFYPLGAIFGIVGAARGLGIEIALHTILCAAGMLLLLRRRGLAATSAGLGAVSLALSSFLVCRIRHIIFPEGLAWLTFALAGAEGYLRTHAKRELALVAASVGLTLLCGALPLLPFFGLFAALYVAPRLRISEAPLRAALMLVAAALVGFALAAAQLAPTLAHLPLSPRALGTSYAFASSYAWPEWSYLATLVVPDLFGVEERARWFGAFNHWEMAAYYVGVWAVALSPIAFLRKRSITLEVIALFAAAILGVTLAFGDKLPVHGWFYRHVPLYAALRCPTRALVMTMLAFSVLGAEGLEAVTERIGTRRSIAWLIVGFSILFAGLAVAIALHRTRLWHHQPGPITPGFAIGREAFAHLAIVLGAGLCVIFVGVSGRATRIVAPVLVLIAGADLLRLDRGYVQPQPFDYVAGTERLQAVEWLIGQHPTDRFALDPHGPFRLHNVGMTFGLESATAYSSVQIFRYVNYLEILASGRGLPTPLSSDPAASDLKRFDSPLVDLLNVRWVIADHAPAKGWIERFKPSQTSKLPASTYEPSWDRRLAVWENPSVLPRAFVVYGAQTITDEKLEQRALAKLDPRKTALVETPLPMSLPASSTTPLSPARVVESARTKLVIEADATQPGVLVVSEADYPGWRVTVDGRAAELLRTDYALRGVVLGAGHHRVEMTYRSTPLTIGLVLSALALVAIGVLAL